MSTRTPVMEMDGMRMALYRASGDLWSGEELRRFLAKEGHTARYAAVESVWAQRQPLVFLPAQQLVWALPNLVVLNVSDCKLTLLPSTIVLLAKLQVLRGTNQRRHGGW